MAPLAPQFLHPCHVRHRPTQFHNPFRRSSTTTVKITVKITLTTFYLNHFTAATSIRTISPSTPTTSSRHRFHAHVPSHRHPQNVNAHHQAHQTRIFKVAVSTSYIVTLSRTDTYLLHCIAVSASHSGETGTHLYQFMHYTSHVS